MARCAGVVQHPVLLMAWEAAGVTVLLWPAASLPCSWCYAASRLGHYVKLGLLGSLAALRFTDGGLGAFIGKHDHCKATWATCGTRACSWAWGRGPETPHFIAPTQNSGRSPKHMAIPCHHSSSYLCCHHYTAHLSHDGAARSNCDAEFRTDCSFHVELRGAWQPITGPCHCVHHRTHPPSMGAPPPGHCKQRPWLPGMVQQVSTTPGGGGTKSHLVSAHHLQSSGPVHGKSF